MKRQQKKLLGFIFMFIFLSNIYYLNNITFLSNDRDDDSSIEEKQIHLGGHPLKESLVFGTGSGPIDLDPLNAWDSSSYDVIRQVVEGLYMLDYSDPDLPRIPILAVDDGTWINSKCWEVSLRQNVFFHDGTRFKASAVKWNFDRMAYFMNATGTLPISHPIMGTSSLYQLGDGKPIINRTEVRGEYKIRFYLNGEFSPLLDLLTCPSGYIVSPASTPRWDYISTATGDIVGTGPYIYDYYTADTVVQYHAWDQYWRGPAQIENLTFSILEDESVRNNAMLSGTIDILQGETESLLPTFRADPNITVDDTGAGASYFYLGMNNERINATWREAISYAINYTYIIEELMEDTASRAYSPLSPAFLPGWDQLSELDTPIFNVTKAREVLQAAGIGVELITDGDWQTATLETFNYSYNTDNQFRTDLYTVLANNLDYIGITVEDGPMTWEEYLYTAYGYNEPGGYDSLELYWVGWGPDYLNPFNILYYLFSNESLYNSAQVNDPLIQDMLSQILSETDESLCTEIYKQLLDNLTSKIYPHVFGFHPNIYTVHSSKLHGYQYNVLNEHYFYPCYWEYIRYGHPFKETLIFGTGSGPVDLDPLDAWDRASNDVVRQVVEGLYMLDYSDPDLPRVPILAVDDGTWINSTCWEVNLRQNVLFHDGTKFNATAVKWNFDRLDYFLNSTGTLPISNSTKSSTHVLYQLHDGITPIISHTTINSEYSITFHLNEPFGPFLDLLTFIPSYILSPASTPRFAHIETATGDIVGTGPYVYDYFTADTEVKFHGWDQYWRDPAQIQNLTFSIIEDEMERNERMLNGTIDILGQPTTDLLTNFYSDNNLTVSTTVPGATYYYLGMNNDWINVTWREAISYAIDYEYIIEELMEGTVSRAYSPLAPAFFPGWDQSTELNTPIFNVTKAREVLQAAGIGIELTSDAQWQAANLATFNYSYNTDNQFRVDLYTMLQDNLNLIGITVEDGAMTWEEFIYTAYGYNEPGGYDRLQLYWVGWGPDYFEPYEMLYSLFANDSLSNSPQVNDPLLQDMLSQILSETDENMRAEIYKQFLDNLTGRIYPHVFGFHSNVYNVYNSKLHGFTSNCMNDRYFYPCYWEFIERGLPFKDTLVFGTGSGPVDLDPLNAWDRASNNVIRQVAEGLYMLDYSDPETPRIPKLAVDDGNWINSTCWEVNLRRGIYFHDGTPFNATAVKWNFDRMDYFMNTTGTLPQFSQHIMSTQSLYSFKDGTPIIDRTEVISEYKIRFYLNREFGPLLDLLAYISAYIISPTSTPRWDYISTSTGNIVGTGPYVYDYFTADTEVRFHRWNQYWRGPAQIQNLIFSIFEVPTTLNDAMLARDVDVISTPMDSYLQSFMINPDISVHCAGTGGNYYYLGMNNEQINATWREAISYAINYSYIFEELMDDTVSRAYSPLAPAFFPGWDQSTELNTPIFNVTRAREVLQAAGIGIGLTSDAQWQAANLATFNYSYNADNQFRVDLYPMLLDNLNEIGITVEDGAMTWEEFIYTAYGYNEPGGFDRLQLYWVGWGPDYFEPFEMLYSLFANDSFSNSAQVNDPLLQDMLSQVLSETDESMRAEIYKQFLDNLTGRIYPHVFGYHPTIFNVYDSKLHGYSSNCLNDRYFYPCYWEIVDYSLEISASDDVSYVVGNAGNNITWTVTAENISSSNYYIYKDSVLNYSDVWTPGNPIVFNVDGLTVGSHEYRIEMHYDGLIVKDYVNVTVNFNYSMTITHPVDDSYLVGSTGNNITWTVTASYLLNPEYYIYNNTILAQNNTWSSGTPIVINVDGLAVGTYEFRIEVYNENEIIEDNVTLIVNPNYSMIITHPVDDSYLFGSTGNNITWTVTASYLLNPEYYIYNNTILAQNNTWSSGTPIIINVDGLAVGTYEFRIEVHNENEVIEDNVTLIVNALDYSMIITNPVDDSYLFGSTGNNIMWTVTAPNVLNPEYFIYNNTILVQNNTWSSGTPIVINVDGLAVGTYEFRIEVHNENEIIEDNVTITVNILPTVLNAITPNPDFDGIIKLNWTDISGAINYLVYRSKSNIISVDDLIPIVILSESNYTDTINLNGIYYFAIIVEGVVGNSDISNCEDVIVAIGLVGENLTGGSHEIDINTEGIDDFEINISFTINDSIQFFYSCFEENPLNSTIGDLLFVIEIIINDTDQLVGLLNFTIEYSGSIDFDEFQILWFNESANGGIGAWEEVDIIVDGNTITFSVSHASLFVLTGTPSAPGDDGDPGDPGMIIIIVIVVVSVIGVVVLLTFIIKKRH